MNDNLNEEKVCFRAFSDKTCYTVMDEGGEVPVIEISGYDLRTVFRVFLKAMVEQLLEERVNASS